MKKTITILLIITIVSTMLPIRVYAENETQESPGLTYGRESFDSLMDDGNVSVGEQILHITEGFSVGTAVIIIIVGLLSILPVTINGLLTLVTMPQNVAEEGERWEFQAFTIGSVVLGKVDLFDINFFKDTQSSTGDSGFLKIFKGVGQGGVNNIIKETVASWYYGIRNLAIVLNLLVLIYMGIRMAFSTISSDKARYKGMLIDWAVSLALIFVLHYIIIIFMTLASLIMKMVVPANLDIIQQTEGTIMADLLLNMTTTTNWNILLAFLTYIIFTVYNIKFFLLYAKRLLSTALLIIISPLITVTYAIDRAGDKKAQALRTWLSEILVNIFIQPLHAILYLVFMFSAANIVKQAPILAVVLFMALSRGEKVVKEMFKMRGKKSINSMSAYLPVKKAE